MESAPNLMDYWKESAHKTVVALREFIWRVHGFGVGDGELRSASFDKYGGELAWLEKLSVTGAEKPIWRKPAERGTRSAATARYHHPFEVYALCERDMLTQVAACKMCSDPSPSPNSLFPSEAIPSVHVDIDGSQLGLRE